MSNLGILFTSRNNYRLLESWMSKVDTEGCKILNIDEDSTGENKRMGKEICSKNDIVYFKALKRSITEKQLDTMYKTKHRFKNYED